MPERKFSKNERVKKIRRRDVSKKTLLCEEIGRNKNKMINLCLLVAMVLLTGFSLDFNLSSLLFLFS